MRTRLISIAVAALAAVAADKPAPAKITYDDHVLPVLRDKCLNCHNADKSRGGLDASTYGKLMEGGASGAVVKPGDPDGSRLFTLTAHKATPIMPPNSPMIAKEAIDTLRLWIEGGALENAGSKAVVKKVEIGLTTVARGKPAVMPMPAPTTKLPQEPPVKAARPGAITAMAASPWAPLVAVAGQKQVLLYHADTFDLLGVLPFPHGTVTVLKFSRNGGILLAAGGRGGHSGKAVLWNVITGEKITEIGNEADTILAADLSADQTQVVVGGPGKIVRCYATKDGSVLWEIKKHTDWVTAIEFSPDGVLLATGDRNGGLFVWEGHTGREFHGLRGHTAGITAVSWRPDGNMLASSSEDHSVRFWEMENGGQVKSINAGLGPQCVWYGMDGRLATCGRDSVTRTWDGAGNPQRQFEALGDVAIKCVLTHDGSKVITGSWSGLVKVWATADGKPLGMLTANPGTVAERLAAAQAEVTALEQKATQTAAAAKTAAEAAAKAAADLAAAQKAVTETAAAAQQAAAAVPVAVAAAQQAAAVVPNVTAAAQALANSVKPLAEAAAKAKDAAAKAPGAKAVADAAAAATEAVAKAEAAVAAAKKAEAEAMAAAKAAADKVPVVQKAAADADAAAKAAPGVVTARTPAVKATADAAAAAKATADAAAAEVAAAKARLERLKSVSGAAK